ncbi:hypothetical protein NMY22_g10107 [Coprinellus aureogranulatus]|nr:hypothetical protein NMY22_g10107 [Coprinellus aureogranulatus]
MGVSRARKRRAIAPAIEEPPRLTLDRPFRHYPVFPKGPITAEEIGDIMLEHKRKYPDVDASSDEESDEESTTGSQSESELETGSSGVGASRNSFDPHSLEDVDIERALESLLGPHAFSIIRHHCPLPPAPDTTTLPCYATPVSAVSMPVVGISQTHTPDSHSLPPAPDQDGMPPMASDTLTRLRPKSKLKLTERARKIYRR